MLSQHRDVFSAIDPREVPQQILARFAGSAGEFEDYLGTIAARVNSCDLLIGRNIRFDRDGANLMTLRGHSREVTHVAALPDGRAISASHDKTLRLRDLASGTCARVLKGHSEGVTDVVALPDGRAISASRCGSDFLSAPAFENCDFPDAHRRHGRVATPLCASSRSGGYRSPGRGAREARSGRRRGMAAVRAYRLTQSQDLVLL